MNKEITIEEIIIEKINRKNKEREFYIALRNEDNELEKKHILPLLNKKKGKTICYGGKEWTLFIKYAKGFVRIEIYPVEEVFNSLILLYDDCFKRKENDTRPLAKMINGLKNKPPKMEKYAINLMFSIMATKGDVIF